jgi:YegS/Rv2252/BmrU family lipid kinase
MFRKILLLVNPHSGTGKSLEAVAYIKSKLLPEKNNLEIVMSEYPGFFTVFLKDQDLTNYQNIIVVGGDGTMHDVVNGLAEKDNGPPVLLFPCGSGNAFNHDIDCLSWDKALANLERGQTQKIDIFRLDFTSKSSVYAFNIVGWGLVSDINHQAEKLRWLGAVRYTLAAVIQIFRNPTFSGTVTVDDTVFEGNFCFVLACNTKHTGKAMKMAPLAELSDGLLDILVVKRQPFYKLLQLFPQIFSGSHISSPLLTYIQAKSFSIDAKPQTLNIDGEIKCQSPFSVVVLPQKLTMII